MTDPSHHNVWLLVEHKHCDPSAVGPKSKMTQALKEGSEYSVDPGDDSCPHWTQQDGVRFYHMAQNSIQFKTSELFLEFSFSYFLDHR